MDNFINSQLLCCQDRGWERGIYCWAVKHPPRSCLGGSPRAQPRGTDIYGEFCAPAARPSREQEQQQAQDISLLAQQQGQPRNRITESFTLQKGREPPLSLSSACPWAPPGMAIPPGELLSVPASPSMKKSCCKHCVLPALLLTRLRSHGHSLGDAGPAAAPAACSAPLARARGTEGVIICFPHHC